MAVIKLTNAPSDLKAIALGDASAISVTEVDGESIDGSLSLVAQVRERSVGDKVTLKILRDGWTKSISVTLTSKPTTAP